MVATQLVSFAVMLAIVIVLSLVYLPEARATVGLSLPFAVLTVGMVAGLSLAVASLNALYRDVEHIIAALLLPWFFLTPVLYSLEGTRRRRPPVAGRRAPLGQPGHACDRGGPRPALLRQLRRGRRDLPRRRRPSSRSRSARTCSAASTTAWQSKSDPPVEDPRLPIGGVSGEPLVLGRLEAGSSDGSSRGCSNAGFRPPRAAHGRNDRSRASIEPPTAAKPSACASRIRRDQSGSGIAPATRCAVATAPSVTSGSSLRR